MTETPMNAAPIGELPSSRRLLRSTAIAAGVALLLLVTVVMPAEYGVDPTGIGRVLGLTKMGEIKVQLAREAAVDAAADSTARDAPATAVTPVVSAPATTAPAASASVPASAPRTDEVSVILRPNEGKEIKLAMRKDAQVRYSWTTDRGTVNYDTHADRAAPPAIKYHGYAKGQSQRTDEGVLVAAFDGMHGWFWRNRTNELVTVTLRTSGDYQELKRME
jgi:hypothetical protein